VFVNFEAFSSLDQEEKDEIEEVGVTKTILNIEDDFDWMDANLRCKLLELKASKFTNTISSAHQIKA
jgi:predicted protein tyrosine phosphatase